MLFCPFFAAVALQSAGADTTDVDILNCRPSRITAAMTRGRGILPAGLKVEALDLDGKIRISGRASQRKDVESYIHMFDVKPQLVTLSVKVESKLDKMDYRLELQVPNDETFNFTESTTGLKVGVLPRINGDGTVTMCVSYGFAGKTCRTIVRLHQNGVYLFCKGPHGSGTWQGDLPPSVDPTQLSRRLLGEMVDPVLIVSPSVRP